MIAAVLLSLNNGVVWAEENCGLRVLAQRSVVTARRSGWSRHGSHNEQSLEHVPEIDDPART